MHIETGELEGAHKMVVIHRIGPMLASTGVHVGCRICQVDCVHLVEFFAQAHYEVCRLNVAVEVIFVVDELDTGEDLVCDHQGCF